MAHSLVANPMIPNEIIMYLQEEVAVSTKLIREIPIIVNYLYSNEVNVSFLENLKKEELLKKVHSIANAQILFWYVGEHGLKVEGVNFYKKIFRELIKEKDCKVYLYDLTAWNALKYLDRGLNEFNPNMDLIPTFHPSFSCLKSSEYFDWLIGNKPSTLDEYIRNNILTRAFPFQASQEYNPLNITVGQVFKNKCIVMQEHYARDTAKSYSAFQYLEGLFQVLKVVQENIKSNQVKGIQEHNIVFALPNDESKYYKDLTNFAGDVSEVLNHYLGFTCQKVNILFCSFQFGLHNYARPYNAGKAEIRVMTQKDLI